MNRGTLKFGHFTALAVLILGTVVFAYQAGKDVKVSPNVGASFAPQNMNAQGNMSGNANSTRKTTADQKFMMTAAQDGMAEVQLGQLALQKTSNDNVRQFAQRMVDDHTKANNDLMQVAQSKGVTLPTTIDPKDMSLMTRLQGLSGAEFDRVYIKEAGVKDHQKAVKMLQHEADKTNADPDVKGWVTRTLPVVQEHLQMAQNINNMLRGSAASGNANMMNGNANRGRRRNRNTNGNTGGNMNANNGNSPQR